jgi:hypothetical protein
MTMDYQQSSNAQGDVRNDSEDVRNHSEGSQFRSEVVRNGSEDVPKIIPIRSERVRNASEQNENTKVFITTAVPNASEDVRNDAEIVRNGSEEVQNGSERVPNERIEEAPSVLQDAEQPHPIASEQFRTAPTCSVPHDEFSITVREAARIFDEAGVPRTERAITNWCNRNARGITRLDACYNDEERKYYIMPGSIERVIKEERKKFAYTDYKSGGVLGTEAEDLSEHIRNERAEEVASGAEHVQPSREEPAVREEHRAESRA